MYSEYGDHSVLQKMANNGVCTSEIWLWNLSKYPLLPGVPKSLEYVDKKVLSTQRKLRFLQKCVFINKNCLFSIFLLTVKCKKLLWSNNSSIYLIDYNIQTIALKKLFSFYS